jgi:rubrerythrin
MLKPECVLKLKEQFKSEIIAYNSYKAIVNMTMDTYLKQALEEIMYDEYLHAKFVRAYLMENDAYDPMQNEELERMFFAVVSD